MRRAFHTPANRTTAYRYPGEQLILVFTLLLVCGVIALTATATICLSLFFVLGMVAFSYQSSRTHHQALLRQAWSITRAQPDLLELAEETAYRLQVEPVEIFIAPSEVLNAYTFGLSTPKTVVLNSPLFQFMDRDELQFILGHEMGHICLGHTWLNSLVGGLAGIPSPPEATLLLVLAFRWWNRACEYSCDRAGLLACGSPPKALSALIKLERASDPYSASTNRSLGRLEPQENSVADDLSELFATHPGLARRIQQLRDYVQTAEYRRLQALINENKLPA